MSKILGIDYGSKRIGLALADEEVKIAVPYITLENKGWRENFKELQKIIGEEDIHAVVMGLPLGLSGKETEQTKETRKFFQFLEGVLPIPVILEDERLSSKQVDALAKKIKKRLDRDSVAAMLILQTYLDKHKNFLYKKD